MLYLEDSDSSGDGPAIGGTTLASLTSGSSLAAELGKMSVFGSE